MLSLQPFSSCQLSYVNNFFPFLLVTSQIYLYRTITSLLHTLARLNNPNSFSSLSLPSSLKQPIPVSPCFASFLFGSHYIHTTLEAQKSHMYTTWIHCTSMLYVTWLHLREDASGGGNRINHLLSKEMHLFHRCWRERKENRIWFLFLFP